VTFCSRGQPAANVSAPHPSLLRLAVVVGLALALVPIASAATPKTTSTVGATDKKCWNTLIKDWYDGRIDKTYPIHCYKDALKHLPQDVRAYSDAYDVISRALAAATRGKKNPSPNALVPPPDDGQSTQTTTTTPIGPGHGGDEGGGSAAPPLGHLPGDRGADGVPVPLLILGGLALLLVAAGAAGLIARRVQARRGGPGTPA
jgi:hypothetical protein